MLRSYKIGDIRVLPVLYIVYLYCSIYSNVECTIFPLYHRAFRIKWNMYYKTYQDSWCTNICLKQLFKVESQII